MQTFVIYNYFISYQGSNWFSDVFSLGKVADRLLIKSLQLKMGEIHLQYVCFLPPALVRLMNIKVRGFIVTVPMAQYLISSNLYLGSSEDDKA